MADIGVNATDHRNVISGVGSARTLLQAESGSIVLFDVAGGVNYTLPPPVVGMYFDFVVTATASGGSHVAQTDNATATFFQGVVESVITASATTKAFLLNGTSHHALTMNGTTTGGILGTQFRISCISATQWNVTGLLLGSGVLATPVS